MLQVESLEIFLNYTCSIKPSSENQPNQVVASLSVLVMACNLNILSTNSRLAQQIFQTMLQIQFQDCEEICFQEEIYDISLCLVLPGVLDLQIISSGYHSLCHCLQNVDGIPPELFQILLTCLIPNVMAVFWFLNQVPGMHSLSV